METLVSKVGLSYNNVRVRIINSQRGQKERWNKTAKQLGLH